MATNVTLSGSVRSNLLALQRTQSSIDVTNSRLNSGKKVNTVIDDAVAYFSAKALDDRASDFDDRKANIDQAISTINVALTATNAVDSLVKQLKGIATSAKAATATERGTLQTQFNTVKAQIDQLVADASYQGLNLVNNSTAKQTTQFSERSSSRLDVTAQRLTTYKADANGTFGSFNSAIVGTGQLSGAELHARAAGLYLIDGQDAVNGTRITRTLVKYYATSGLAQAGVSMGSFRAAGSLVTSTNTYAASISSFKVEDTFGQASGLNIFQASQIYIFVDANLTGSLAATTFSTGTQWSAAAFDPSSGLANDQFTQALDFVIRGLDSALSANNSVAKALGTNVAILNTRLEFTKEYVNVQKEGSGKLTLADTNEEGANLVSLQTRQQLGVQALSFAGQTEQSVLRLFG